MWSICFISYLNQIIIRPILIFYEITSGWRINSGGAHKVLNINPDIVIYGKTIANGIPMGAIVGKKDIMEFAQSTFISSTFWTERIGPSAALKTLDIMEKIKSWEIVTKKGNEIKKKWKQLEKKNNIKIISSGGTYKSIKKLGYDCIELSSYTGFKEMLDGRVKTLHPKIHAGILHDRKNKAHKSEMSKQKFH